MIRAPGARRLALAAAFAALGIFLASGTGRGAGRGVEREVQGKRPEKTDVAELGKPPPGFELTSLDGKVVKLSDYKGKTVVLQWFNPACPFCKYAFGEDGPLRTYMEQARAKGVVWISIVSEKPENPGAKVDEIRKFAADNQIKSPVLLDPEGKVGKLYTAKTTPQACIISEKDLLVYRGAIDNAPMGKVEKLDARVNYIAAGIADLASGHAVMVAQTKPYGTPIQYARP
jgi:peroxiredoxin